MVDGGKYSYIDEDIWSYERYGGADISLLKSRIVEIEVTEKEMYDDWNESIDKLGVYEE